MREYFQRLWDFLNDKVSITITPSSRYRMRSFQIRLIIPLLILIIVTGTMGSLGYLFVHYRYNYSKTRNEFIAYKERTNIKGIKSENKKLKKELIVLTQDTEKLRRSLQELKEYNSEIRQMLNIDENTGKEKEKIDFQLTTILSYNQHLLEQGVPTGGRDYNLYYHKPEELIQAMHSSIDFIREELPEQRDNLGKLEDNVKRYNAKKAATPGIWPLADRGKGYISSEFGWRVSPVTGDQEYHEGLDIGIWYNTPVLATADGVVSYAGWLPGYGYIIKIRHGFGYKTYYGHLNKFKVKKGQKVKRGQVIALSGNSGRSTGPHLHYEVRVNNIPQNPRKYIGR